MYRLGICALFITWFASMSQGQCIIKPIKPIPPIGCRDVTPQCVTVNNSSYWTWICVPLNADSSTSNVWKSRVRVSVQGSPQPSQNTVPPAPQGPPEIQYPPASESDMDEGERLAVDQLREIAEAIKKCTEFQIPIDPQMAREGFVDVDGPPQNVIWNVVIQPSIRARYQGYVEYTVPNYFQVPPTDDYCNQPKIDKKACKKAWSIGTEIYQHQADFPFHFKYEFDVSDHGIEFIKAFKKNKRAIGEPWVEDGIKADGCGYKSIQSVLSNSNTVPRMPTAQDSVLDKAKGGDIGAQFVLGLMYAQGNGVPQDYVEAYFWLDIVASSNSDSTVLKARDEAASHLTQNALLETQERARKWFEMHP
jgi:hypothetical protein